MGWSYNGMLAYGFDLGGVEGRWHLENVEDWEPWLPGWLDKDTKSAIVSEDSCLEFDYASAIQARLEAEGLGALTVSQYGNFEAGNTGIVLAAWAVEADGASTKGVSLDDLMNRSNIERWDNTLAHALAVLDVHPHQPHPLWLLTQWYG